MTEGAFLLENIQPEAEGQIIENIQPKPNVEFLFKFLSICRFNLIFANPFLIKPCKIFNGQHNHFS